MSSENTGSMYNNFSGSAPSRRRPSYDNGLHLSAPSSSRANSRANGQRLDQDQGQTQRQTQSQSQGENPSAGPNPTHYPNQNQHQNGMNNNTPRQGRARPDREENTDTMLETFLNERQAEYQKYSGDSTASIEKSERNHIEAMKDTLAALERRLPGDQ